MLSNHGCQVFNSRTWPNINNTEHVLHVVGCMCPYNYEVNINCKNFGETPIFTKFDKYF